MSSGLSVVATDAGSITEVVDHGRDGLIVPQRSPEALATAIADLLGDAGRRSRFAQNAAARVRAEFDVATCEQIFHDRLSLVLAGRSERTHNAKLPAEGPVNS